MVDTDENPASSAEQDDEHLRNVDDGCGCTEIWEHVAEQRDSD